MNASYDTEFASAVRRAANGIRPKAGIDVTVEGAALRAILCSNHALDPDGLELLALAVTGRLRKVRLQQKGETSFAQSVRRASAAWRSGKGDKAVDVGEPLAVMLRLGMPALGAGEREILSELLAPAKSGDHNALEGRPWKGPGHADVVAVLKLLEIELSKVGSIRKNVVVDIANRFGISVRTVEEYEATSGVSRFKREGRNHPHRRPT